MLSYAAPRAPGVSPAETSCRSRSLRRRLRTIESMLQTSIYRKRTVLAGRCQGIRKHGRTVLLANRAGGTKDCVAGISLATSCHGAAAADSFLPQMARESEIRTSRLEPLEVRMMKNLPLHSPTIPTRLGIRI